MSQPQVSESQTGSSKWLVTILDYLQPSEDVTLVVTAIIVGLGTGLGSVVLRYLISGIGWISYEWIPDMTVGLGKSYAVIMPAIGGLFVGILVYNYAREAKGHGVPEVMEAIALHGGRIRPRVAGVKAIASSLTIGSGGSAGREGPIVQIGSALGSTVGQLMHLSEDRIRNLVACGAAAGIAATFNAPIAGVIFSLEVILDRFSVRYFSTVVISSVVASVLGRAVFGDTPAFPVPTEYGVNSLWEYAFYPVLGILAALVGVAYVRTLYGVEDFFDNWKSVPEWFKPAIGAALLGFVALAYPLVTNVKWDRQPQIYNVGYEEMIDHALSNELILGTVLTLLVLKLVATSLTLGSGGSGGVFAPGLFMGAMLGTAFEIVANRLFPNVAAPPGAYAILGMAAVFAATAHAPMTGIIILFELTDNHRIILPLMLTVVISTLISRKLLNKESIYTLKLSRRGIRLESGRDVDVMQGIMVREAMVTNVPVIYQNESLTVLRDKLRQYRTRALCVLDEKEHLCGIVTLGDLQRAYEQLAANDEIESNHETVADICSRTVVTVSPDDVLWTAIRNMGARDIGRLPVIAPGTGKLIGMIRRDDIMNAYNMAISRKLQDQHTAERMRLNVLTGAHVFEMRIENDAPIVGKEIRDIDWPVESVVAAIRRQDKLIVPHGDTQLQTGDMLTMVAVPEAENDLDTLFGLRSHKN